MPAPATCEEFLDLVRKSGVVEEKRLGPHVDKLRTEGRLPGEPNKLAGVLVRDGILTHFQAEQLLQGKWRRFTIGKYKVLERLGSGGMGQVYLCEHKLMRRRVAVKVLPTAKAAEESSLGRFYREARAVAALDHPNIVHAYDIDQDDALHFLVMEYVDGADLQVIVKKSGPLDPIRAAHYIYQATQGLAHAQLAGLVHRDIKPGNLLVDRNGVLKILDMGLARFFNDEEDMLTRKFDENVLGTADYLAPEQTVDSHEVDIRADIYSLGATFYFLLTGRTVFEEGTVAQKLIWHQTRQPKPISTFRNDVPPELIVIIEKMMAKAPEDRYQHPLEVAEALKPWVNQPIPPPPESEMPRLSPAASGAAASLVETSLPTQTSKTGAASSAKKNWQVTPAAPSSAARPSAPATPAAQSKAQTPPPTHRPAASLPTRSVQPAQTTPPPNSQGKATATAPLLPPSPKTAGASPWEELAADKPATQQKETSDTDFYLDKLKEITTGPFLWLWVGLAIAILGLVVFTVALWRYVFVADTTPPPPARPPLKVSKEIAGAHRSIERALREAQKGDIIELWDVRHQENIIVDPQRQMTTQVTIRPAAGKKVVWTFGAGNADQPLLRLNSAQQFRIEGKGLTLDGQGKMPALIQAGLQSTGLTIADAHLKGFTKNAVQLINCAGTESEPVVFKQLHFTPAAADAAAFWFDARPNLSPPQNDYIHIRNCHFHDMPPAQRVQENEKADVMGKNVQLP